MTATNFTKVKQLRDPPSMAAMDAKRQQNVKSDAHPWGHRHPENGDIHEKIYTLQVISIPRLVSRTKTPQRLKKFPEWDFF
jgi:hypothetical protein